MTEQWKPIIGFPAYEISNLGRCRRVKAAMGATVGRIKKPWRHGAGYLQYGLTVARKTKPHLAHRLVCEAFILNGSIPRGMVVNHKNGIRDDNRVTNLEVIPHGDNLKHGFRVLGSKRGNTSLKNSDIPEIKRLSAKGVVQGEIAAIFGVDRRTIGNVLSGKTYKHI